MSHRNKKAGASELAKAAQNPIAAMISLPFQNNTNFNVGPEEGTQNVLNIQPVWSVDLNPKWNLITRTILPVISQPEFVPGQDRTNGIGDIQFSAFFSPKAPTATGWIGGRVSVRNWIRPVTVGWERASGDWDLLRLR